MKVFVVGASPYADIVLTQAGVVPRHAELVLTDDGRYHITDCGGVGGTWRRDAEAGWTNLRQAFVGADEVLRLGEAQMSPRQLLAEIGLSEGGGGRETVGRWHQESAAAGSGGDDGGREARIRGRVERDPVSGEIIQKRY